MRDVDQLKDRVRKLLSHAADRQGTPEGDVFYAKAFELMAAYGFEHRDLSMPDEGDEITHVEYTFNGAYTDMQARLLLVLAQSLHCTGFYRRVYNSVRVHTATIFGLRSHLERVALLYGLLAPVMITKAQTVKAENWHESTVVRRRSFMTGFASRIGECLAAAEDAMAQQSTGYALALRDDVNAAQQAAERFAEASQLTLSADRAQRMFDSAAYVRGQCAGDATDIGQVRVQAKPALPF